MSIERATRLKNGKIIGPTSETPGNISLMMAEANSVDTDPCENNDVPPICRNQRKLREENHRHAVRI